jgi:multimeric flavodoxin WrbA
MKLLGLSCGRKNGNGEVLLKEALLAAQQTGDVEVEIIRLLDIDIKPCIGCEGCTQSMSKGGSGECVRWKDDDGIWLRDKFEACDGLITSAPCFVLRPSGNYCSMNDRFLGFSPRYLMEVFNRKKKVGAAIAVGGSDWTQFMLVQMMPLFYMLNIKVVDKFQAHWVPSPGQAVLRDDLLERAAKLGRNIASAMKKPVDEVGFMGDSLGVCPYCHCDLLAVKEKRVVVCPVCDIKGELSIVGDEITVAWSEEDLKHIRWEIAGMGSHLQDIKENHGKFREAIDVARQKLVKYQDFAPYVSPVAKA